MRTPTKNDSILGPTVIPSRVEYSYKSILQAGKGPTFNPALKPYHMGSHTHYTTALVCDNGGSRIHNFFRDREAHTA